MSYRSSSGSEYDDGDPEEFRDSLAEIKNRIGLLARQCEAIARRNGNAQQHRAPDHRTDGVPQALAHFSRSLNTYYARRFEQISSTGQSIDVSRSLNGRHLGAAHIAEVEKEPGRMPARDTRAGFGQLEDSQLAEIRRTLADITQKLAEQTERNQSHSETFFKQVTEHLASRAGEIVQALRSDYDTKIAALTNKVEQQVSSGGGLRPSEAAEKEALLLAELGKIAAQISDKHHSEAQALARSLDEQLKRSLSTISSVQVTHSELFINEFVQRIDGRLAAIAESFNAELANMRKKTSTIHADVDREIAGRADRKRADSVDAEVLVKKMQEHLDRCISEIAAFSTPDTGKNDAKFGKIDRSVAALGERVDGLIASLAEAERASSARGTALAGSLENTAAALAEKSHADSQSLARILESNVLELSDSSRAEAVKTTVLIGSLDEKVAALAEKGKAETESLARTLRQQIQGDVLKLAEDTRAELTRTMASVAALETKIEAFAGKGQEDSAALARTFQSSLQELSEATRAETERATGLARSLETKIAALHAQTQADSVSLANALTQKIESQSLRLTQNAQAESAKMTALVGSLEHNIAALTQAGHGHSEALAKTLYQKIETHVRELAENTRAEAARTTSFIESLEKQIATSSDISRTETAEATALLDEKIAALGERNKADSESLARTLGQQIEHHVQGITEYTRAEAARTAALVSSLEHTVTVLAEKGKSDSESLANTLGQEISGQFLRLTDNARVATAKTLDLIGSLEDRVATLAEQGREESVSLARTLSQEIERRALELTESTRADAAVTSALIESKIAALSGKVQADTELLANTLSRQIEGSVRQLAENTQADAAKTAALLGTLEAKIAAMAERGSAESAALAQTFTQQIEGQALQLGEKVRAESAGTAALLEQRIAALAESGKADTEALRTTLGQKIEAHVLELAETTRAEASKTTGSLDNKITVVAEKTKADTEAVAKTLAQQIDVHARELTETSRTEAAKTAALVKSLHENVSTAAGKSRADSESLRQDLGQQIETHSLELARDTRAEVEKTRALIEEKIATLAESGKAVSESMAQTLSQQIETRALELSENTKTEAAKATTLLEEKIAALGERSEAEAASRAKVLSHQIESHVRELTETARTDAANTTALVGSLEEKIAAFAEKNRATLELQAITLGSKLKAQLAELSEASSLQAADLRIHLDTGIGAIEHSIATISEASRAEFHSRFKSIDEQFCRRLDELAQQNVAKTEALAESLRHKIDLGVAALIEGSNAESAALESLLRTLMEQIYRKVGMFADGFGGEFENSRKEIDGLRNSIDRQLDALTESSQEHFSHLIGLTGGLVERLDAAEAGLSHIEAAHAGETQPLRQLRSNGEQSHAPTNGHASTRNSDAAKTNGAKDSKHLVTGAHDAAVNGDAVAAKTKIGELAPTNGTGAALNGRLDGKSDTFHTDDPFDPPIETPEKVLICSAEEPAKRRPRIGYVRRWLGFNRTK